MIDIVIAWVDGEDPTHKSKRKTYITGSKEDQHDDIAGSTRFSSIGEIEFCVGSILRFAPFVNKIFIVTDNQDPKLIPFVERNFPENKTPIEIVDHKVLFEGYEQYLPNFNSLSIETMLFRMPNLSENFVYLNDDFFLAAPISPEDWFVGDSLVCYGSKFPTWQAELLRWAKSLKGGAQQFGYKDAMLNAAKLLGKSYFRYFPHAPIALHKSCLVEYYQKHPEHIVHNIKHRFREHTQFNPQVLCHLLAESKGQCKYIPEDDKVLFLKPDKSKEGYMARKLDKASGNKNLMFGCINSLDKASTEEQAMFRTWIQERLNIKLSK